MRGVFFRNDTPSTTEAGEILLLLYTFLFLVPCKNFFDRGERKRGKNQRYSKIQTKIIRPVRPDYDFFHFFLAYTPAFSFFSSPLFYRNFLIPALGIRICFVPSPYPCEYPEYDTTYADSASSSHRISSLLAGIPDSPVNVASPFASSEKNSGFRRKKTDLLLPVVWRGEDRMRTVLARIRLPDFPERYCRRRQLSLFRESLLLSERGKCRPS